MFDTTECLTAINTEKKDELLQERQRDDKRKRQLH